MVPKNKLIDFCEINKFEHLILEPTSVGLIPFLSRHTFYKLILNRAK